MKVKDLLKTSAPEPKVLAAIRDAARQAGKSRLSMREIDREIKAARAESKKHPSSKARS
jgi:hypothetical protein